VLEKDGSTLDDILKLARNGEAVKLQDSYIEESKDVKVKCESIAAVAAMGAHKQHGNKEGSSGWKFKAKECGQQKPRSDKKCYGCGYEYPHEKECPAKGKKCNSCKQIVHFERCCKDKSRQSGVKAVGKGSESPTFEENEGDGFLFTSSNDAMGQGKSPMIEVQINKEGIRMLIDSGAHDDVVDETTYNSWTEKPWLRKSKVRLFSYCANEPLRVLGEFDATIEANGHVCRPSVKAVSGSAGCLLSCFSSRRLGLFQTAAFNENL
jgi:hypothetical protein